MSLMGYKQNDILEMQQALEYAIEDAQNNGDEQNWKSLIKVFDFLEGILVEGRV